MNNRVGYSPLARSGQRVALGTDGIGGDMITESQLAYFRAVEAGAATDPGWPVRPARRRGQARRADLRRALLGSIAAGAPADLTVLSYDPPAPLSAANLPGHWVFGLAPGRVRDVIVDGELVVADRPVHPRRRVEDREAAGRE